MGTLSNKYFNAQAVEDALDKGVAAYDNMGQIELVYNGTDIRFSNEVVNFQQIVDYITTDARFCYMVYNNRVLLTSDMQLTGGTRYVFFETSTTDSGLSKNTVVKVYSADGTTISSISYSTIANENFSNKVSTIADNDKNSTVHYPSNKAVTEITDEIKEDLTNLKSTLLNGSFVIRDVSSISGIVKETGYVGSVNVSRVVKTANASYDSYWVIFDRDTEIYAPSVQKGYYSICVIEDATGEWSEKSSTVYEMFGKSGTEVRYRNVSDNNLPTSENPIEIKANSLVLFSFPTNISDSAYIYDYTLLSNDVSFNTRHIVDIRNISKDEIRENENLNSKVKIHRGGSNLYMLDIGKYWFYISHVINSGTNSNLWNITQTWKKVGTEMDDSVDKRIVPAGTDIIGPIRFKDASDYSGGVHGDEETEIMHIYVDGVEWDYTHDMYANSIELVMASKLYHPDTKVHLFNRYISVMFTNSKVRISNCIKCVSNGAEVSSAPIGGLMSVTNSDIIAVKLSNKLYGSAPTENSGVSHNLIECTYYLEDGSITSRNIKGNELATYSGNNLYYDDSQRNKVYFFLINGNQAFSLNEELLGVFEYMFE